VRRLVEEWRDQLAVALKPCLISASQMKQKQRLKLRPHKREIDEETLASCLVEQ
jgi:hypothetical protein